MFREVHVAAVSFKPKKLDLASNANRLETMFREAASGGAQLAVGPEGVLEGYVVNEIIDGGIAPDRMNDVTLTMKSKMIRRFRDLAKELKMCLVFGLAERIGDDVYNCAVFLDQKGRLCGKYHKMQLAEGYHTSWWWNRLGNHIRAFDTPFGRAGMLICNDRWNPEIARIQVLDGAQYLIIPSFGDRSRAQDKAVLMRARENGVPVVEANVGVTLIISQGEVVAVSRKQTVITCGTIAIPALPSTINRDVHEKSFLKWREEEMPIRYTSRMKKCETGGETVKVKHDSRGRLMEG